MSTGKRLRATYTDWWRNRITGGFGSRKRKRRHQRLDFHYAVDGQRKIEVLPGSTAVPSGYEFLTRATQERLRRARVPRERWAQAIRAHREMTSKEQKITCTISWVDDRGKHSGTFKNVSITVEPSTGAQIIHGIP